MVKKSILGDIFDLLRDIYLFFIDKTTTNPGFEKPAP